MYSKGTSPIQNLHVNQILAIQKLIEGQAIKTGAAVDAKCDKMGMMQTENGASIILKNPDYDWWIRKDNPQVKRLQTAYLQDIKIHRCVLNLPLSYVNIFTVYNLVLQTFINIQRSNA